METMTRRRIMHVSLRPGDSIEATASLRLLSWFPETAGQEKGDESREKICPILIISS